jgi:hypothetical protein
MADGGGFESVLPDLDGIDVSTLDALPDSVLRSCLLRIIAEKDEVPENYVAFKNFL